MADNREPPETVADEKELFVMALSEFFKGYATIREARHVPVTASMKAKNFLSISQIVLTTLMGVRDPKAPMEIFAVSSERPDPRKGLLRELTNGTLVTIGYLLPRSVNDRPVVIPSEYWLNANPNFDENALAAVGLDFVQVQVVFNNVGGYPEVQQGNGWVIRPLPELARFGPSEAFRQRWDLPAVEADQVANTMPEIGVDVPEQALAAFAPSEARGARLALPVAQDDPDNMSADATGSGVSHPSGRADVRPPLTKPPANPRGRPSKKEVIIAACHAIKKEPNWLNKELVEAILDHIKANSPEIDSKGLSDQTILRVVRSLKPR